MRQLNGLTKNILYVCLNGRHYLRLSPISADYVQKQYKSSIAKSSVDSLVVNKNMTLRYCHPQPMAANQSDDSRDCRPTRPLVVMLAWMLAREQHLEKYRNLYFSRGFDVLTVKTSPFELLLPEKGSQPVARNVLSFINDKVRDYPEIVIHAFSVGGYQFGEMLVELEKKSNELLRKTVVNAVKGVICDSGADLEAIPSGLSRAVTTNPVLRTLLKSAIQTHMKLFRSIATKHYMASSHAYKNRIIRSPGLLLVSREDIVGNTQSNQRVMDSWVRNGIEVTWKCFDKSTHVGHFIKYPEEYEREIDSFLKKISII